MEGLQVEGLQVKSQRMNASREGEGKLSVVGDQWSVTVGRRSVQVSCRGGLGYASGASGGESAMFLQGEEEWQAIDY